MLLWTRDTNEYPEAGEQVFKWKPTANREVDSPKSRWEGDEVTDLREMRITDLRTAED